MYQQGMYRINYWDRTVFSKVAGWVTIVWFLSDTECIILSGLAVGPTKFLSPGYWKLQYFMKLTTSQFKIVWNWTYSPPSIL